MLLQFDRIPHTIGIGANGWVLVRHRVDAQPQCHQVVVHIAGTEVAVARFLVAFLAVENEWVRPCVLSAVVLNHIKCSFVHFRLIPFMMP